MNTHTQKTENHISSSDSEMENILNDKYSSSSGIDSSDSQSNKITLHFGKVDNSLVIENQ